MNQNKNVIEEQSINDINYELLKKQFPHAVSIDEDGKYSIDPQKLQMSLDPSKAEIKEDGYGLNWVGKKEAYHTAFTKNYKVLKPLKDDSKNWDETENILIKGDNLDALKILRQNYFESIKMIYIDPPYNTKNDGFVYNDDFTSSTEKTLEELGYDKEYIDYIENIQGAKTHSGWLSFIYPRLLLARDLLKDDGVIFISIDDNEMAQLKLLCDEVFSEDNFIGQLARRAKSSGKTTDKLANNHDYLLIYEKNKSIFHQNKHDFKGYNFKDEYFEERGYYKLNQTLDYDSLSYSKSLDYPIEVDGDTLYPGGNKNIWEERQKGNHNRADWAWRWNKKLFDFGYANGFVVIKNGKDRKRIYTKTYEKVRINNKTLKIETFDRGKSLTTIEFVNKEYSNDNATKEIKNIFGKSYFDYAKPTKLIKKLIEINTCKDAIIMDFFAGSGTTAHSIMELNAQDNGRRQFITVQIPESLDNKTDAFRDGYETIFDITKARIDKAGKKLEAEHNSKLNIENSTLDIGFRTFEIVEDQKQKIYQKSLEEVSQDDLVSYMEKPDIQTCEDILYNLFVAEALPLSTKHEELIKDKLYLASNVAFILGDITSDELVDALKDKKECEYITVYSPNISDDKFTLEIESNISKLGIKPDKLRFRG
ncbi:MAG: site-specific DNA-methyltransferase [Campylobacterota bacterium]|nr:site-specific DNA-methyltransferase [Campylobacterota bacterium]